MDRLKDRVAVISGGAAGIGEGDARLFAREGAKVIVTDINEVDGQKIAEDIKKEGGEAVFMKLDVSKEDDWKKVMADVVERYGKINILVNNAGISPSGTVEDVTLEQWHQLMDVNLTGTFLGLKYAIKAMKGNRENCSIINRGSVNAYYSESLMAAYCASKGAIKLLSKAAALHCAENGYNIRVNCVHPGFVHTQMPEKEAKERGITYEEYKEEFVLRTPLGREGEPVDVAYTDLYFASDDSLWVTGTDLIVDGGLIASGGISNRPKD